ncbi:MAG: sulfide/dihydroorotate dehydrogenase-like FAD/NAD-binding protein [bacterium]|nr:sulfide/dihydroorotate dehydrogenase-like FAD/NAD-binding protein [bacterium]
MKLTIDGKTVSAREGETILDCALRHDISIPHLCTHSALPPFGACRLCLVEIEGMRGYPTSCTTPAEDGMVVRTDTEALGGLRRNILSLIMLEHPSACLVCAKRELCDQYRPEAEKAGRTTGCHTCNNKEICDVRVMAEEFGLSELPVPPIYHERPVERSNPFIDRDLNLCILCGRCVRICRHHQEMTAIDFIGRGSKTRIGEAFGRSPYEAGCQFCGACVDVCPTGSLCDRYAKWRGRPERRTATTCLFCNAACALELQSSGGELIGAKAVDETTPICVLGRFAIPEFLYGAGRLRVPVVRADGSLRETQWKEAIEAAAEKLRPYVGSGFALVCDTTSTLQDRYIFRKFAREVMRSENFVEIEPDARGASRVELPPGTKAALLTGDFVDAGQLEPLELLIVQDCYPTPASEHADIVLPVALFPEVDGTLMDVSGRERPLRKACEPPGQARPEWWIVAEIAKAMGAEGFAYDSVATISREVGKSTAELLTERDEAPPAATDVKRRRAYFRGHRIDEKVPGLRELPLDDAPASARRVGVEAESAGGFRIVQKREVAPNIHEIVIEAPGIAKKAQPGQFVIVMVDETSERAPYTLSDWDAEEGTITLVVLEVGHSSRKLTVLREGDRVAHLAGPLGIPAEVDRLGTVVVAGGCYGIGAIIPIARAMREAGNRVIGIVEARSHYLHYFGQKLEAICDELIQTAIDGSMPTKGHAADVIGEKLRAGEKVDRVVVIGCPFMMMLVARETQPFRVKTLAALNSIMLDGTGMCGACRVSVGGKTKFACVDGPFFDAHLIDWDELFTRRRAYAAHEVRAVGRTESVALHACEAHGAGAAR